MNHNFFSHSFVDRHLVSFWFMTMMNKTAINIVKPMSFWYGGACFGNMLRSGIVEASDRIISNSLRNCKIDFQSGFTKL